MENMCAVIDTTSRAILAFPQSYTTAVYVAQGIVNSEPVLIPSSLPQVDSEFKQFNLNTDILKLTPKDDTWVSAMPDMFITKELLERRNIAKLRSNYIYVLEQQFKMQNFRSIIYHDESVAAHLLKALKESDPMTNTFAYEITEYANIQGISPLAAYQELSVMLDSSGLIKIRNFAWFVEYVRKFNSLTTVAELDAEMINAWDSLVRNAYI